MANRDKLKLLKLRPLLLPIGWALNSHNSCSQSPITPKFGMWIFIFIFSFFPIFFHFFLDFLFHFFPISFSKTFFSPRFFFPISCFFFPFIFPPIFFLLFFFILFFYKSNSHYPAVSKLGEGQAHLTFLRNVVSS